MRIPLSDRKVIAEFMRIVKNYLKNETNRIEIMIGRETKHGFIDFANTKFKCPHCKKKYDDIDDKYLDRCNKNKNGCTTIHCVCNMTFGMSYDYMGDAVAYKL